QRNRRECRLRIEGEREVGPGMNNLSAGDQKQGVAVRWSLGDKVAADNAVGARAVLYDDLLFEALAELRANDFRDKARWPIRRKGHDEMDRPVGIAIGCGGATEGQRGQQNA